MFKLVVLLSVAALAAAKPSAVVAPVAYSTGVVPGVSSVSQYSSSVLHGAPAVYGAPALYGAPTVYAAGPAVYSTPALYGSSVLAPLAQPAHSPAVVLDAVNGVPLDTPEVVAARAAHFQAKALSGYHHVGKRSVVTPVSYSNVYSGPALSTYSTPLVSAYSSPVVSPYSTPVLSGYSAYSSPLVASPLSYYPKALSVHPY